jgi:hypothetical protein
MAGQKAEVKQQQRQVLPMYNYAPRHGSSALLLELVPIFLSSSGFSGKTLDWCIHMVGLW